MRKSEAKNEHKFDRFLKFLDTNPVLRIKPPDSLKQELEKYRQSVNQAVDHMLIREPRKKAGKRSTRWRKSFYKYKVHDFNHFFPFRPAKVNSAALESPNSFSNPLEHIFYSALNLELSLFAFILLCEEQTNNNGDTMEAALERYRKSHAAIVSLEEQDHSLVKRLDELTKASGELFRTFPAGVRERMLKLYAHPKRMLGEEHGLDDDLFLGYVFESFFKIASPLPAMLLTKIDYSSWQGKKLKQIISEVILSPEETKDADVESFMTLAIKKASYPKGVPTSAQEAWENIVNSREFREFAMDMEKKLGQTSFCPREAEDESSDNITHIKDRIQDHKTRAFRLSFLILREILGNSDCFLHFYSSKDEQLDSITFCREVFDSILPMFFFKITYSTLCILILNEVEGFYEKEVLKDGTINNQTVGLQEKKLKEINMIMDLEKDFVEVFLCDDQKNLRMLIEACLYPNGEAAKEVG